MPEPIDILKQYYGYTAFRPLQEDIIRAVLAGKDTLALLPTGGGKSVCYQVPALLLGGLCLVVTPLIALMKDQVMQLRRRNVSTLVLHSGMSFFEVKKTLENATTPHFRFLFVSPERLQTRLFREYLPGMPLRMIAVDEAHCISQWGYDFRPPYLRIADVRDEIDPVPVLALTASATPEVQTDICTQLRMQAPAVFRQTFARPNLSFSALETVHKLPKLLDILQKVPGSALVYCRNRKLTREIAEWLHLQGQSASYYHAGLSTQERSLRQEAWIQGQSRIMACTNAFGMGIDKANVRVVVHMGPPDCLEDYYQEAGRAGRDGQKAYAVVLYNPSDLKAMEEQAAARFPPLEVIQQVYQAVANYLQLPIGAGEGQYFEFDLTLFADRFKMELTTIVHALKTLAAEGYLSFSESVFLAARAGFVCSKEYLYNFQAAEPGLEPLTKALLRSYEGIFDNEVNISERNLAYLLQSNEMVVKQQLQQLQQQGIIQYTPRKDTPQVFYPYPRIPAQQVVIDAARYQKRKQLHLHRIREMIKYTAVADCRSLHIQHYFGEAAADACGVCDRCVAARRLQQAQQQKLMGKLPQALAILQAGPLHPQALQQQLGLTRYEMDQLLQLALREEWLLLQPDGSLATTGKGQPPPLVTKS